jgi:uncharacterized 2Fe-2S/4Fe-4S cluster protein (DUF4445 family)
MNHKILISNHPPLLAGHGACLLDVLTANGIILSAPCGGRGICGKCRVRILNGRVEGTQPDRDGTVLSCHARVVEDLTLELPAALLDGARTEIDTAITCATADVLLDVGTTTLAWAAIDRESGKELMRGTELNPQRPYGADVLSRIHAWSEGKGEVLQRLILDATRKILTHVKHATGADVQDLTVVANPTMLHLFLGVDPSTIGVYPFTPVFKDTRRCTGEELSLPVKAVTLLPSAHAYIGSDVTAGALATGIADNEGTHLLVDVGTNGEILLSHNGHLLATSCAAGPALEGACIECGVGGIAGAICHVSSTHGTLHFETVDNAPPVGICGSGLIDLIALLVAEGLIDESGAWDEETESSLASRLLGERFYLCDTVYLSQADIRQFQLAKSAIAAGIVTLLAEQGLGTQDVDAVYLAGGLGYYMNVENAIAAGLLPDFSPERIKTVGNSALTGAYLYATDAAAKEKIEHVASDTEILELSFSARFSEEYVERMSF